MTPINPNPAGQESGKQRAKRISLDHHSSPERLTRAKWRWSFVAVILVACYATWMHLNNAGPLQFSPGDVSVQHASFEHQCQECHAAGTAQRADAWDGKLFGFAVLHHSAADANTACLKCHTGDDHQQIDAKSAIQAESCGGCHQDHQGRDVSLARVDNSHCVHCHEDLNRITLTTGTLQLPDEMRKIKSSHTDDGHPVSSRSIAAGDPGNIHFRHDQHMTAGVPAADRTGELLKYRDLNAQYRKERVPRWQPGMDDEQHVQLSCISCHESENSIQKNAIAEVNSGAYMSPIRYEKHCQECHPLRIGETKELPVPHGLSGTALRNEVEGILIVDDELKSTQQRFNDLVGKQDPLEASKQPKVTEAVLKTWRDYLSFPPDKQKNGVRVESCVKCHKYPSEAKAVTDVFAADVLPPNIPVVWLKHARFDHRAHRGITGPFAEGASTDTNCLHCHNQDGNYNEYKVTIPQYKTCLECHTQNRSLITLPEPTPRTLLATPQIFFGARSDCVECHHFHHDRDWPLAGPKESSLVNEVKTQ